MKNYFKLNLFSNNEFGDMGVEILANGFEKIPKNLKGLSISLKFLFIIDSNIIKII